MLMIYANDVVLLAYAKLRPQKHLHKVHIFCEYSGLGVNITIAKVMVVNIVKFESQHPRER